MHDPAMKAAEQIGWAITNSSGVSLSKATIETMAELIREEYKHVSRQADAYGKLLDRQAADVKLSY